jgi:hypothetical protein
MKDFPQHLNMTAAEWQVMRTECKKPLDTFQAPAREQHELIAIGESAKKNIVIGAGGSNTSHHERRDYL